MGSQLMVADLGPRPMFSDSNHKLLPNACALVRRLKTYISSRFNVYHNFIKCQLCKKIF